MFSVSPQTFPMKWLGDIGRKCSMILIMSLPVSILLFCS
uniref:Uncharacterized protein n=1 Tax=Anguilla anguilla TaxID=7936 RepID=A0A0E9TRQ2_ANGAN